MASFTVKESTDLARIFAFDDLERRFNSMLPFYIQWADSERDVYHLPKEESLAFLFNNQAELHTTVVQGREVVVYATSDDELIEALSAIIQNFDAGTYDTFLVFQRKEILEFDFPRLAYLFAKYVVLTKLSEVRP